MKKKAKKKSTRNKDTNVQSAQAESAQAQAAQASEPEVIAEISEGKTAELSDKCSAGKNSEKIQVAMIGLGGSAGRLLEALANCSAVEIVGVADRDAQQAKRTGLDFGVPHYTDNRQLLLGTKPTALFLATPPMPAMEIMESCASLGIHVWKEAPLGRNLSEAVAMARRFEAAGLKLAVGTQRRFAETYRRAHDLRERIGENKFLARAEYFFNWGTKLQWRSDIQSAGGGALLELGYHFIDLLIWLFGLPEEVYGLTSCNQSPAEELLSPETPNAQHDTDDVASALLKYKSDTMATLAISRRSGPVSELLAIHGRDGSLVVSGQSTTLRNADGDVLEFLEGDSARQDIFNREVDSFIHAVQTESKRYECSAMENLLNHAVVEAIYLSSHTGQPENPLRQLEIQGLSPAECLKYV